MNCAVGAIRWCLRQSGSGPSESPPSQPGRTPPWKGTDDNRTATAQGDVAWAAAVFQSKPPGRRWGTANGCAVMIQSPHTLLKRRVLSCLRAKDPNRKSRPAAQLSGGHRRVTRKATGDPTHRGVGNPAGQKEQCTCDRGFEEGAAHRHCGRGTLQ